jgi:hypothetical protein
MGVEMVTVEDGPAGGAESAVAQAETTVRRAAASTYLIKASDFGDVNLV